MLDTSAIVAVFDEADAHHDEAIAFRDSILAPYRTRLFTTLLIASQSLTWLKRRVDAGRLAFDALDGAWHLLAQSPLVSQLPVTPSVLEKAFDLLKRYSDQPLDMVDCTTFLIMEQHQIPSAFTFDDHFNIYRYRAGHTLRAFLKLPEHTQLLDLR